MHPDLGGIFVHTSCTSINTFKVPSATCMIARLVACFQLFKTSSYHYLKVEVYDKHAIYVVLTIVDQGHVGTSHFENSASPHHGINCMIMDDADQLLELPISCINFVDSVSCQHQKISEECRCMTRSMLSLNCAYHACVHTTSGYIGKCG